MWQAIGHSQHLTRWYRENWMEIFNGHTSFRIIFGCLLMLSPFFCCLIKRTNKNNTIFYAHLHPSGLRQRLLEELQMLAIPAFMPLGGVIKQQEEAGFTRARESSESLLVVTKIYFGSCHITTVFIYLFFTYFSDSYLFKMNE